MNLSYSDNIVFFDTQDTNIIHDFGFFPVRFHYLHRDQDFHNFNTALSFSEV